MQDFLGKMLIWISTISFTSLILSFIYHWIFGHIDSKHMWKSMAIIFTVVMGITLTGFAVNSSSHSDTKPQDFCTTTYPYLCGSWPLFASLLAKAISPMIKGLGISGAIPATLISIISCIYIYSRLIKGVWVGPKQIASAFLCGVILYVSMSNFAFLKDSIWNVIDQLFSADGKSNINEFVDKMNGWDNINAKISFENSDSNIYKSYLVAPTEGFTNHILQAFQTGLMDIPLYILGLINFIIIFLQQFYICVIPISVIKSIFTFENNPFVVIKSIFGYTIFCVGLHVEMLLLSAIPKNSSDLSIVSVISDSMSLVGTFLYLFFIIFVMILFLAIIIFTVLRPLLSLAML